jgi:hypothetical protein
MAESRARKAGLGVWSSRSAAVDASHLTGKEEGFRLIQGVIDRIGRSRRSLWLNLRHGPALRIDWKDWAYFSDLVPEDRRDHRLEVRGWLYRRKGQQRMQVRHPSAIRWLD